MRTAINAAIIEDKKILLVKKNEIWILPGGKPSGEEDDISCLLREVAEELSETKIHDLLYYKSFQGMTPHKKDLLEAKVYFAKIYGTLNNASAEIKEARFVNDFENYELSDITSKIISNLKTNNYL